MTGYGRGESSAERVGFVVELSSVNRKNLDVISSLPRPLQVLDAHIIEEVHKSFARGRVNANVVMRSVTAGPDHKELVVDDELAADYLKALKRLSRTHKLDFTPSAELFMRMPEVMSFREPNLDVDKLWPVLRKALRQAMKDLRAMRDAEGERLSTDLHKRLAHLAKGVVQIRKREPQARKAYGASLRQRLATSGLSVDLNDERLLKELAIFAEKCDFSEELTRLDSHLEQFLDKLKARGPVGRALDFLCQELFREISTLGVKAQDAQIARKVIDFKSELEKLREQVQNVE
ncbi:MAG: hypothetical protein ACI9TH_000394 [Kiritimatiellia bacterium]|jgi:uncharacterized protein (TIGR00255 family)